MCMDSKISEEGFYGQLRRELGAILHGLAKQKECEIEEGHLMRYHVHMLISIPPKFAVARQLGSSREKVLFRSCVSFVVKKELQW